MWKRKLIWGSFAFVMFFVFTLVLGSYMRLQPANAALFVSDKSNTVQSTKTAINTATTAINTATQVANQIRNLASMSPEGLLAHYLGISEDLAAITSVWQAYNGLMAAGKTMEESWNSAFKQVDSFFSGGTSAFKNAKDSQSTLQALEKTYKDSMNTAKQVGDTEKSITNLQNALNKVATANGAKEVAQANSQVASVGVQAVMAGNAGINQLVIMESAKGQAELQEKSAALAVNTGSVTTFNTHVDEINNSTKTFNLTDGLPAELATQYNNSFSSFTWYKK